MDISANVKTEFHNQIALLNREYSRLNRVNQFQIGIINVKRNLSDHVSLAPDANTLHWNLNAKQFLVSGILAPHVLLNLPVQVSSTRPSRRALALPTTPACFIW
jgi:hypothetical protein